MSRVDPARVGRDGEAGSAGSNRQADASGGIRLFIHVGKHLETKNQNTLEDHALDLGMVGQVDVPDQQRGDKGQDHERGAGGEHARLGVAVGLLDPDALGAADGVGELDLEALVDVGQVGHRRRGQVLDEGLLEGVGPDGARDGGADGAAGGADGVEQGQGGGHVLVVDGGEDGHLLHDDEDAAADRDEDLAHDQVADRLLRAAEVDHQAQGKGVERDGEVQQPLEVAGLADGEADADQQHARDHVEGVVDVPGVGHGHVVDGLQERGEVVGPAVVRDLVDGVEQACADHVAVRQEGVVEQRRGRGEPLVEEEGGEEHEADDDHGDDVARRPAVGRIGG